MMYPKSLVCSHDLPAYVPCVRTGYACPRVLRTCVPCMCTCLAYLRTLSAYMPCVPTCLACPRALCGLSVLLSPMTTRLGRVLV